eukprot:XP_024309631.1 uncharacterized protein LOC107986163 [Homo sapiens]
MPSTLWRRGGGFLGQSAEPATATSCLHHQMWLTWFLSQFHPGRRNPIRKYVSAFAECIPVEPPYLWLHLLLQGESIPAVRGLGSGVQRMVKPRPEDLSCKVAEEEAEEGPEPSSPDSLSSALLIDYIASASTWLLLHPGVTGVTDCFGCFLVGGCCASPMRAGSKDSQSPIKILTCRK